MGDGKIKSILFRGSSVWREYKSLYDQIGKAKSLSDIDKLDDRSSDLTYELEQALPDHAQVADDLGALLHYEIKQALRRVQPTPGKPPAPDYFKQLDVIDKRMLVEARLVESLLSEHITDAWVRSTFYDGLAVSVEIAQTKLKLLEKQQAEGDVRLTKAQEKRIQQVRDNLGQVRRLVGGLPRKASIAK